MLVFE